jgi:hypothetical protein
MPASYPSSLFAYTNVNNGDTSDASQIDNPVAEIIAIETALLNGFQHALKPLTNNTYTLGDVSHRWSKVWTQDLDLAGVLTLAAPLPQTMGGTGKDTSGATDGQVLIGKTSDHSLNLASLTAGAGITITPGAGAITIANTQAPQLALLYANSGTSSAAGATTVDSIAISGLTVKDTLIIELALEMTAGGSETGNVSLVSTTDSNLELVRVTNAINAADQCFGTCKIYNRQSGTTALAGLAMTYDMAGGSKYLGIVATATTAWTGSWTLGLRYAGLTGGTFQYRWSVYKLAGQ